MIKMGIKRGFTLVELLVVVAILAILSGAAYLGIQRSQARVMNEKVVDDLAAISNALEQFKQDEGHYPNIEDGELKLGTEYNINCFASDTTYSHDCEDSLKTAFIQTQVDNNLLTKRYLQEVPTDPQTKSRYVYGVTTDGQFFQVAGNYQTDDGVWIAKVRGNVEKGFRLPSLLRAFNGPNFVMDGEGYLPYSPDHLNITATLDEMMGPVQINGSPATNGALVQPGDVITTGPASATVAIYFSDGSVTYLDGTAGVARLQIHPKTEVEQNDKDGIITKIRLKLFSGKIWSKVARLASESEFNVETTNSIAGVRGTEFGIDASGIELTVLSGAVAARQKTESEPELSDSAVSSSWIFSGKTDIDDNFIVTGQGTFDTAKFYIPDANAGTIPQTGTNSPDENHIKTTFYKGAFNNNYRPRILEVDTTNPAEAKVVFEYLASVNMVKAVDPEGNEHIVTEIVPIPDVALTIKPTTQLMSGKQLRFQFVSAYGNATGFSDPAVSLMVGAKLTEEDIYNMGGQGGGGQCTSGETQMQTCQIPNGYGKETRTCLVGGTWGTWSNCILVNCIPGYEPEGNECLPSLPTLCDAGNGFLYFSGGYTSCWKVASGLESCNEVCSAIAIGNDHLNCSVHLDWTVDSYLCDTGLGYTFTTNTWATNYSPVLDAVNKCKNDTDNTRSCTEPAVAPYKRICRCD